MAKTFGQNFWDKISGGKNFDEKNVREKFWEKSLGKQILTQEEEKFRENISVSTTSAFQPQMRHRLKKTTLLLCVRAHRANYLP